MKFKFNSKMSLNFIICLLFYTLLTSQLIADENSWSTNGPSGASVYSIELHPQNPQIIYIGTIQNGIYKTTDGGNVWSHLYADAQISCMREIAIHPNAPETVYATSTEGMFKSFDNGASWSKLYPPQGVDNEIIAFLIHPDEPNLLFAGGPLNEWKSTDGGQSWQQLGIPHLAGIRDIALDPSNHDNIYLVCNTTFMGAGVFKSTDRGQSWQNIQNNLVGEFFAGSMAVDFLNPSVVYVGFSNYSDTDSCLFKSTDGGQTWQDITPPNLSISTIERVAVSTFENNTVYACTRADGVFKSTDGGATWESCNEGLRIYLIASIGFDALGRIIYLGTYRDGIYRSIDNGATWQKISFNINASSCQGLTISPNNPDYGYVATVGGVYRTTNMGMTWEYIPVGYSLYHGPGDILIDNHLESNIYLCTHHRHLSNPISQTGFYRSTDNGITWNFFNNGLPADDSYHQIALSYEGNNNRRIFLSSFRGIYYSDNLGEDWNICSNGMPPDNWFTAMEISPLDPDVIAAGDEYNRIFISYDRGVNWSQLPELPDMSGWYINDIEFHPYDPDQIYVASGDVGLFKTTDGGQDWLNINNDLPVDPHAPVVSGIAVNPYNPSNVFVSSSRYGIYQSHNGGQNWEAFNTGLDTTATAGFIEFAAADTNQIYFASKSRSVWTITRTTTDVGDRIVELPSAIAIRAYPNPFNSQVTIEYEINKTTRISIDLYDILGKKVRTLSEGRMPAGKHKKIWNGENDAGRVCPSGVYFARLIQEESDTGGKPIKLILLK